MPTSPNAKNPQCDLSLASDNYYVEFDIQGGAKGIVESASVPSTLLFNQAGSKFGDWGPKYAHDEQSSWDGGMLGDTFTDDKTKYADGSIYSLTPGKLHNPLLRQFASGFRVAESFLPTRSFSWKPLLGNFRYLDTPFKTSAQIVADRAYIWIRRCGNPGTLTLEPCADASGDPDTVISGKTVTITTKNVPNELAVFQSFDWATTTTMTTATKYHLKIYGASTDTDVNHWEVGIGSEFGSTDFPTKSSAAGSTWANTSFRMFYRVVDADVDRIIRPFLLEGIQFAVDEKADGSASEVWINGDQGICASNSGNKLLCNDGSNPARSWTVNGWTGYRVKIIAGPGVGEDRAIISNSATALTVDVLWGTTHTTSTRYCIYGGPKWTKLTLSPALTGRVKDFTTFKGQAEFAQGSAIDILRFQVSPTLGTYTTVADTANQADFLRAFYDADNGNVVWKALAGTSAIARAPVTVYGATASVYGTSIDVGDSNIPITSLSDHNGNLKVQKEDSNWVVQGDKPKRLPIGLDASPSSKNGIATLSKDLYFYWNWSHSVQREYGATIDDFGPWKGSGMPPERRGYICALEGAINNIFGALNAESGVSSVLAWNNRGWHEIFRAFERGKKCQYVKWEPVQGGNPIVWISYGGELCYLVFPKDTMNPLNDANVLYEPEGYIDTGTIDMDMTQIPKVFKDVDVVGKNISGDGVDLYYQFDDEIGTSEWHVAGSGNHSPVCKINVGKGRVRAIRYRLRITANDVKNPPVLSALVFKMFGRSPTSRQWTVRVKAGGVKKTGRLIGTMELNDVYDWLWKECQEAGYLVMHSRFPKIDNINVIVEPPGIVRTTVNSILSMWSGVFHLTVIEV
jgi:hypothetical protein